jgi:hypothetical protein
VKSGGTTKRASPNESTTPAPLRAVQFGTGRRLIFSQATAGGRRAISFSDSRPFGLGAACRPQPFPASVRNTLWPPSTRTIPWPRLHLPWSPLRPTTRRRRKV